MTKRLCICGILAALLVGALVPGALPARAQTAGEPVVLALESARAPGEAWAAAFASTAGGAALDLEFVATAAEITERAHEAAVIITDAYEEAPPIDF